LPSASGAEEIGIHFDISGNMVDWSIRVCHFDFNRKDGVDGIQHETDPSVYRLHGQAATSPLLHRRDSLGELPLMRSEAAVEALGALAQEHRLALFRLLVQAGEKGMAAGVIAVALGLPNSSLSFHLAQLRNAGLILQERKQRSLIYRANYPVMNKLVAYLMENCCTGGECGSGTVSSSAKLERKSA
jgi:ArsR family transcriptional regulator, arsenate/arsenite/antimonite-responsive transcriptional repressor